MVKLTWPLIVNEAALPPANNTSLVASVELGILLNFSYNPAPWLRTVKVDDWLREMLFTPKEASGVVSAVLPENVVEGNVSHTA